MRTALPLLFLLLMSGCSGPLVTDPSTATPQTAASTADPAPFSCGTAFSGNAPLPWALQGSIWEKVQAIATAFNDTASNPTPIVVNQQPHLEAWTTTHGRVTIETFGDAGPGIGPRSELGLGYWTPRGLDEARILAALARLGIDLSTVRMEQQGSRQAFQSFDLQRAGATWSPGRAEPDLADPYTWGSIGIQGFYDLSQATATLTMEQIAQCAAERSAGRGVHVQGPTVHRGSLAYLVLVDPFATEKMEHCAGSIVVVDAVTGASEQVLLYCD